jgi:hypothetical protein
VADEPDFAEDQFGEQVAAEAGEEGGVEHRREPAA